MSLNCTDKYIFFIELSSKNSGHTFDYALYDNQVELIGLRNGIQFCGGYNLMSLAWVLLGNTLDFQNSSLT